jgi:YD repeat-containing protein
MMCIAGPKCGEDGCFDALVRPTRIVRSSSLNHSKIETRGYFDLPNKWVMGQLEWTAIDGTETARATYDQTTAQMEQFSAFGERQQTLTYRADDGTVETITDARDEETTLASWYRGVPREITYADATTQTTVVNDAGWITSITDQNGFATGFGHDDMGRITTVTPPGGDTLAWLPTTITYTRATANAYGLTPGHWKRTESRGTYRKETWFDALWRPVIEREHDATSALLHHWLLWFHTRLARDQVAPISENGE